ncbi:uncharacterized protein LOC130010546 [Patella vulgata]|uniref:uncharacterized protein LOC130010546 n=1 Tax=Patella vulgata TaxID=6465 RepID=UPI0024A94E16|nr:uncharacterized protein LOC130010546 [Patella vulgata]
MVVTVWKNRYSLKGIKFPSLVRRIKDGTAVVGDLARLQYECRTEDADFQKIKKGFKMVTGEKLPRILRMAEKELDVSSARLALHHAIIYANEVTQAKVQSLNEPQDNTTSSRKRATEDHEEHTEPKRRLLDEVEKLEIASIDRRKTKADMSFQTDYSSGAYDNKDNECNSLFTDSEQPSTIPRTNDSSHINIVLSGKTGAGKSYTGNYLIGKPVFQSKQSPNSITSKCETATRELGDGKTIKVIDTPGLFDTRHTIAETLKELYSLFCISTPGPHVFLYVMSLDARITEECKCAFKLFKETFGQNITNHLILVLNRISNDPNSISMIKESEFLMDTIKQCNSRYICLDYVDTLRDTDCNGNFLDLILKTVSDNAGSHYTSDMYSRVVEPYNDKLKLEEDIRKLTQQVQALTGLLEKQELGNKKTDCVEKGRMSDAQYTKIQTNYTALLEEIAKPLDLCIELYSTCVFDENDKIKIESEKVPKKQTDKLLMTLVNRGQSAFDKFLQALTATGHDQARNILEQDERQDAPAVKDKRYFVIEIKFPELKYKSGYNDPSSDKYKKLKDQLERVFRENGHDAAKISFRDGSVIVTFVFVTTATTDVDNLLAILHKVLTSGYLGQYKVSKDYFLFCRIGAWLTNRNTDETEEVTPVIGDENTVSLTEQCVCRILYLSNYYISLVRHKY